MTLVILLLASNLGFSPPGDWSGAAAKGGSQKKVTISYI